MCPFIENLQVWRARKIMNRKNSNHSPPKDAAYWETARTRITDIRRIDRQHNLVFGSDGHRYRIEKPIVESRLKQFECRNGVDLPVEYRTFLGSFGAGGAGPDYGIFAFSEVESHDVSTPFHITDSTEWPEDDEDPMWHLSGLLPISTSGCGVDWSIEINGPQPGTMWVDAGPGDHLMRCQSFGTWFGDWLDRIELGLRKYELVKALISIKASVAEISCACKTEPHYFESDGGSFCRFLGVPGCLRLEGEQVASFQLNKCWIS